MYELGKFEECRMTLQHLLAEYPNCEAAKNELVRTEHRLREREHGDYGFRAMYEAANKTPPCLDQATFVGPVAVKASKGRGRGLLTTKAVAAGDLLICEKAFAYCFAAQEAGRDSSKVSSTTTLLMNTHNDRGSIGTQADLLTAVVQKLYRNLSLSSTILSMYRADYSPVEETEVDGVPIVDTFVTRFTVKTWHVMANPHQIPPQRNYQAQRLRLPKKISTFALHQTWTKSKFKGPSHDRPFRHRFLYQS